MSRRYAAWRRIAGAIAVTVVVTVGGPLGPASAHDELTGTEPADGVEVADAPAEVRLQFGAAVAQVGTVVTVTGPLGEVSDGEPTVAGTAVTQPLVQDVPPGDYAVLWRVTSQDGHPISGEFDYQIASAGIEAQAEATSAGPADDAGVTSAAPQPDASTATPGPQTSPPGTDRVANTEAAPAQGDQSASSGTALWVWGVLALALLTLGGLAAVAVRRR
ncbi:MAG: copper resistance CopC family protein [Ornithinimicrobium sp.]